MALIIDLFSNPGLHETAQCTIRTLQVQIQIVKGLEHAKSLLEPGTQLGSSALDKCRILIDFTNRLSQQHSFVTEIAKLSLDELAVVSISYTEKRLAAIQQDFNATRIRSYIRSQNIKVSDQAGIHRRIVYYLKTSQGNFGTLYRVACEAQLLLRSNVPTTTADSPFSLEFNAANCDGIESVFGKSVADAIHKRDLVTTDGVRTKLSRSHSEDDMMISLEVAPETSWLSTLFPDGTARFDSIKAIFGPTVAEAIDRSQLRNWERENGLEDQTRCVEMASVVRLRLASDLKIANTMYSTRSDNMSI